MKTPEYMAWQHDPQRRARRDTEQPVEISPPDPVVEPPSQEPTQPQPTKTEPPPRPVPDPQETPRPNIVKRPEPDQSVPRQRDEMSKLSRKEATVPSRPTQMVQLPDVVPRPNAARIRHALKKSDSVRNRKPVTSSANLRGSRLRNRSNRHRPRSWLAARTH